MLAEASRVPVINVLLVEANFVRGNDRDRWAPYRERGLTVFWAPACLMSFLKKLLDDKFKGGGISVQGNMQIPGNVYKNILSRFMK